MLIVRLKIHTAVDMLQAMLIQFVVSGNPKEKSFISELIYLLHLHAKGDINI